MRKDMCVETCACFHPRSREVWDMAAALSGSLNDRRCSGCSRGSNLKHASIHVPVHMPVHMPVHTSMCMSVHIFMHVSNARADTLARAHMSMRTPLDSVGIPMCMSIHVYAHIDPLVYT